MAPKIKHKRSAVAGKAPQPADLDYGEIAVNYEASDPALYVKDSANVIRKIGTQPDATATVKGLVQLADAAAITAGTAGRVVDAAQLKAENLWDRAGTVVSPANAGDDVDLGAGDLSVTDAFVKGVAVLGGGTAAPRATIAGSQDGTGTGGKVVFSTTADGASSSTERMRITNSGLQRIYSSGSVTHVSQSSSGAGTTNSLYYGAYGATDNQGTSAINSYVVWSNGNVQNTNNSYTAISDIKLKENIADAGSQWADLKALRVRNYNLKEGQTHRQIGLIAQEVEPVSPGLVYESPDRDAEGNDLGTVTKSVNYSVLYMKAVKALQEAMERIEQLEQRLTDAGIA